jgi:hypothetical protein
VELPRRALAASATAQTARHADSALAHLGSRVSVLPAHNREHLISRPTLSAAHRHILRPRPQAL